MLVTCRFETERLLVEEWHSLQAAEWAARELHDVVTELLTESVTGSLPPAWQGRYTTERARRWVEERDAEGPTLLVIHKADGQPVGLVILFEEHASEEGTDAIDVRLGYLLAEDVWGQGIASELLAGFVGWCRRQPALASLTGGVAADNPASARVLEKNGFQLVENGHDHVDERLYRLHLR